MSEDPITVFKFTAEGVDLEFAGSEEFVEKQVERFRAFLESAIGDSSGSPAAAGASAAGSNSEGEGGTETLEAFYAARPTREGRGAIQVFLLSLSRTPAVFIP